VPARTIPVPQSISNEAQKAFTEPKFGRFEWPSHAEKETWKPFVREWDAAILSMMCSMPPFPGDIRSQTVGRATLFELIPFGIPPSKQNRAILFVHGGAYVMGGGEIAVKAAQTLATLIKTNTYVIDYRMPPDDPFPAALDDVVLAYKDLLARYAPGKIGVIGGSAGAALAASSILKIRDLGLPLPATAVLVTPESDLTESGDSFETNKFIDNVLVDRITESILLYADGHDLRDPYLSPLFGDFSLGFPPTLLISGTRDLFLSNTTRLHRALRKAGIEADLHIFEAMPHGGFGGAPEDLESLEEQILFIDQKLGRN
jgi:acetyl esterase/lipase